MAHVVTKPTLPFRARSGAYEVHQVPAAQDNLVWLLVCTKTGDAAIIDGPDAVAVLHYAEAHGIRIRQIWNTHTHGDHIGVNRDLERRGELAKLDVFGPAKVRNDVPGLTRAVDEGDTVELGPVRARVMRTEGHIEGHICFVLEDVLFSGDTLFAGGCGRVFTGDYVAMHDGLSRLAALDPELRVCCAHEYTEDNLRFALSVEPNNPELQKRAEQVFALRARGECAVPSHLGVELATNPMLRPHSEEIVRSIREQAPEADVSSPLAVFTATRKLKDSGRYRKQ